MRRRAILVAVLVLAVLCSLFLLRPDDPVEAARRRVPLGSDVEAVVAAVGRPGGAALGRDGHDSQSHGREVCWVYERGMLFVEFDEDGRAVKAEIRDWQPVPLWQRLRAWWPW
jgi:hypothetical protein